MAGGSTSMPSELRNKNANQTKFAAMSKEELEEVSSSLKDFKFIQANKWPGRSLPKPCGEDDICQCTQECGPDCNNRKSQIECSIASCPLRQSCTNLGGFMSPRSIPTTIVARSEMNAEGKHVGLGLFLSEGVKKRQEIDSYTGEVKTQEKLQSDLLSRGHEAMRYDIELTPLPERFKGGPMVIDAYNTGNKSRYINHACEPNCAPKTAFLRSGPAHSHEISQRCISRVARMCTARVLTPAFRSGSRSQCKARFAHAMSHGFWDWF